MNSEEILNLAKSFGFKQTHSETYEVWEGILLDFANHLLSIAHIEQGEAVAVVPYRLGNEYQTLAGDWVKLLDIGNMGTSYETMCCADGVHRYTRRDFGRCTGSSHTAPDPRNLRVLYTHPASRSSGKVSK